MDASPRGGRIRLERVSKIYRVFASPAARLKRFVGRRGRYVDVTALAEVTLSVEPGEVVGIVGENGAGKSTLLRIVSGTTAPTSGAVEVEGTVASILELGAGFHPEFTGRENALMYGALMGLGRREMEERLPRILEFAELGEVVDHPVKSYSTGMAMRLAFAVATHVEPEVLIVDEALAVGDGYFQKKCVDHLLGMKEAGVTILFCTHALYYVTQFCDRAVWLERGRVRLEGRAADVVREYETHLLHRGKRRLEGGDGGGTGGRLAAIAGVRLEGAGADGRLVADSGPRLLVHIAVASVRREERLHLGVSLDAPDGRCIVAVSTRWDGLPPLEGRERYELSLEFPRLPLASGVFDLSVFLLDDTGLHVHDQTVVPRALEVQGPEWTPALVEAEHRWRTG